MLDYINKEQSVHLSTFFEQFFLCKSVLCSFTLITVWLCIFWQMSVIFALLGSMHVKA